MSQAGHGAMHMNGCFRPGYVQVGNNKIFQRTVFIPVFIKELIKKFQTHVRRTTIKIYFVLPYTIFNATTKFITKKLVFV